VELVRRQQFLCCACAVQTTGAHSVGAPRAVPEARPRDRGGLERVARATRPATLGDKLNEGMRVRVHTTEAAAQSMGVPSVDVLDWSADAVLPDRKHEAALLDYLEVDERELHALVLRSQMRRAQARIRN